MKKLPVEGTEKDTPMPQIVEAAPISQGYLHHAVISGDGSNFYRTSPWVLITYRRALCGVGRGGLRVYLDRESGDALPWKGIDGCDRCHARLHKLRKSGEL